MPETRNIIARHLTTGHPRETDPDWTHEYDRKEWCEPCRNYRSPRHTAEHWEKVSATNDR